MRMTLNLLNLHKVWAVGVALLVCAAAQAQKQALGKDRPDPCNT